MPGADVIPGAATAPVLWLDGAHPAAENMARDAALLEAIASGAHPGPVLRLYTFSPAGITLGRAQDPARELDLEAVARDGVTWAVRPTGGGAIWHERAWTLSLTARLGPLGWARTARGAYARTAEMLVAALRALGIPAEAAASGDGGPLQPRVPVGAAPPCFASSARHEVRALGRKLAGIAQRVAGGACLLQIHLLLGDAHARLVDYLRVPRAERSRLALDWTRRAIGAERWLERDAGLERLGAALAGVLGEHRFLAGEAAPGALGLEAVPRSSA